MRRLLLATTAISALALAPALALAQVQSNGPSGAIQEQPRDQEQKAPKGGKSMTPAPGKSAQTQAPQKTEQPQRLQGQAQPENQGPKTQAPTKQHLQGQAQPEPKGKNDQQRVQGQAQPNGPQHVQGQAQQPAGKQENRTGTASTTGSARSQVQVTQQQKTEIHQRISQVHVQRIEHPQFSVSVGVAVPRSVHIEVLPPEIVEIVPEYQGFDYVVVGDEIVIIDPGSLEIVAVIPA